MNTNQQIQLDKFIAKKSYSEARQFIQKYAESDSEKVALEGCVEIKLGSAEAGENLLIKALELDDKNVFALSFLSDHYCKSKKFNLALPYAEKMYRIAGNKKVLALNYAACLSDQDRAEEAIDILYQHLGDGDGFDLKIAQSLASLLRVVFRHDEALSLIEKIEVRSHSKDVLRTKADILSDICPQEAVKLFNDVLHESSHPIQLQWNWSFVELRLGNFELGWKLYENGLSKDIGKVGRPLPAQINPEKLITNIKELDKKKYTIFTAEQGIGDQILFLGCMHEVLKDYPKSVLVCEHRMMPILKRSFPEVEVLEYGVVVAIDKCRKTMNGLFPIGSLQQFYRNSREAYLSKQSVYLQPNDGLVSKYRSLIQEKFPNKKIVGISWRGGFWNRQKQSKSIEISDWDHLLSDKDTVFVCLQYGDISEEKTYLEKKGYTVLFIEGIDFKKDIDAWFALACACDRIVSVSTALVHFVGAAGKRVDLMLGEFQTPFIWGLDEGMSLPYKNVRIHRKQKNETVGDLVKRVSGVVNE